MLGLFASVAASFGGCVAEVSGINAGGSGGAGVGGNPIVGTSAGPAPQVDGSGGSAVSGGPSPATGTGGSGAGAPSNPGPGACSTSVVPLSIQTMLSNKCWSCHGGAPLPGAPTLVTFADLTAQAKSDPTKTNAVVMLARIQSTTAPMPPVGGAPATAAEVAALGDWAASGYASAPCPSAGVGGASGGIVPPPPAPTGPDPFAVAAICTSNRMSNGGESATMDPGQACVSCHRSSDDEAPIFAIAGTLYPTAHEPNDCNGVNGTSGARIVITGADGTALTLTPNSSGSFTSQTAIKMPYRAKVTYLGRERLMIAVQTSGDCNACHTQAGTNLAPGRIILP